MKMMKIAKIMRLFNKNGKGESIYSDEMIDLSGKLKPVCPECGNSILGSTWVDYGEGKDMNDMWCDQCGYSAKEFEWKTFIKKGED